MKKLISMFLACTMMVFGASAMAEDSFSATARGFGGDVTVTLTIDGDRLVNVTAEGADETAGIGGTALEQLPQKMVKTNSVEVDGITGATFTSNAILTAAAQALSESGVTLTKVDSENTSTYEDVTTDVVVVGGGITGMSAAIALADAGQNVVLLEKTDVLGGAATTSHSSVWAVGSELTKDKYDFTADEIYEFFNRQAGPVYNKDVFYALANESYNSLHFLMDNGVVFEEVSQCNPQADPRFWCSASVNFGAGMIASLTASYNTKNIDTRMKTTAVSLVQNADGAVTGVVAECDGQQYTVNAKKVILATGGIGQNAELCEKYVSGYANLVKNNTFVGDDGDGHIMGVAAGGYLVGTGSMGVGTHATGMAHSTFGNGLLVNVEGEQVGAANEHYTKLYVLVNASSNGKLYSIFPADIDKYSAGGTLEQMEKNYQNGELYKADIHHIAAQNHEVSLIAFIRHDAGLCILDDLILNRVNVDILGVPIVFVLRQCPCQVTSSPVFQLICAAGQESVTGQRILVAAAFNKFLIQWTEGTVTQEIDEPIAGTGQLHDQSLRIGCRNAQRRVVHFALVNLFQILQRQIIKKESVLKAAVGIRGTLPSIFKVSSRYIVTVAPFGITQMEGINEAVFGNLIAFG